MVGIRPNPDPDLLDTTRDENKEVAESSFAKPVSEAEIKAKIDNAIPKSTKYKEKCVVELFESWREQRNLKVLTGKTVILPD